ncbi:MAG: hypothetical protein R6U32_02320 [Candidatus Woesearchaeota archaeon]
MTETVCIPKSEYLKLKREVNTLRKTHLYKRLLEFEKNISPGTEYTREKLGF